MSRTQRAQRPFSPELDQLVQHAPLPWIIQACHSLRTLPASTEPEVALLRLPASHNADNLARLKRVIGYYTEFMSWEAFSWLLESSATAWHRWRADQAVELLWSGPAPQQQIEARRLDQVLYDLIANAQQEILLLTFAAYKIARLNQALTNAVQRGVAVRLVLEFEADSAGQLTMDAIKAFSPAVQAQAEIWYWPLAQRELKANGKPGKLHAKVVVVDGQALISSANLTDDAFNRNLELGALLVGQGVAQKVKGYVDGLCADGVLRRWGEET